MQTCKPEGCAQCVKLLILANVSHRKREKEGDSEAEAIGSQEGRGHSMKLDPESEGHRMHGQSKGQKRDGNP